MSDTDYNSVQQPLEETAERVAESIDDASAAIKTEVQQTADDVREGADQAATKLREGKREVERAADRAVNTAAVKTERAADQVSQAANVAADKAANSANQAAAAATQAANRAGNAAKDFQARLLQTADYLRERAQTYSRNPTQLSSEIRALIDSRVRERLLVIFLVMWAPIWIMAIGSGFGTIMKLFLRNLNYGAGVAAAAYVWTLLHTSAIQYQQKLLQLLLISSALPIFILDIENPILKVISLLAFTGAPFILSLIYHPTGLTGEKEDLNKVSGNERIVQFATAIGAIFGLSVLPGDHNLFHRLLVAAVFAGAAFAVNSVFPIIRERAIPPHLRPQVDPHEVVIFGLLELLVGNLLLFILSYVLPASVVDAQSSGGAIFLYSLIGLVFLEFGNLLTNNFLADVVKLPPATLHLIRQAGAGAIFASYAGLMISYLVHWGPFGISYL